MRKFIVKVNGNQYEVEVEEVTDLASQPKQVQPNSGVKLVEEKGNSVRRSRNNKGSNARTILKINIDEGNMVKSGQYYLY